MHFSAVNNRLFSLLIWLTASAIDQLQVIQISNLPTGKNTTQGIERRENSWSHVVLGSILGMPSILRGISEQQLHFSFIPLLGLWLIFAIPVVVPAAPALGFTLAFLLRPADNWRGARHTVPPISHLQSPVVRPIHRAPKWPYALVVVSVAVVSLFLCY